MINFEETKEYLAQLDKLCEKRKEEIRSTPTKISVTGTTYYVSNDGDDNADGKTPETAWRTLHKVSCDGGITGGDAVLFRRGDVFRGMLIPKESVTYSAYGDGEKPVLTGTFENSAKPVKWLLVEGTDNLWMYERTLRDVGVIIFDKGESGLATKYAPALIGGEFYLFDGEYKTPFDMKKHLANHQFFSDIKDWHGSDVSCGMLYLRCDEGNPGEIFSDIEICTWGCGIESHADNVTIDNLCIKYCGSHGFHSGDTRNLIITNCEIGYIGGAVQFYRPNGVPVRFGNGAQIFGNALGFTVDNCYVHDCFDAGVSHQYNGGTKDVLMNDVVYTNNLIEDCCYSIEYFNGVSLDGKAVRECKNCLISGNILRRAGYGFGMPRIEIVPCAHFVTWNHKNKYEPGTFVIENNILDRTARMMVRIRAFEEQWLPVMRGNTYVILPDEILCEYQGVRYENGENLAEIVGDKTATIYYADSSYAYTGIRGCVNT